MYVTKISNGDYIKLRSIDLGTGASKFKAHVSVSKGGKIEIHIDAKNGSLLGTLDIKNTSDIQTWKTLSCKVNKIKGVHDIYFVFKGGEGNLFNFDWWQLVENK